MRALVGGEEMNEHEDWISGFAKRLGKIDIVAAEL